MVTELLWFLRGDTNIKYLVDNNCHIWDGDAYKNYIYNPDYKAENYSDLISSQAGQLVKYPTQEDFINKIKTDEEFAKKWGDLGKIYGHGWRNWNGKSDDDLYKDYSYQKEYVFDNREVETSLPGDEISDVDSLKYFFQKYISSVENAKPSQSKATILKTWIDIIQQKSNKK